VKCGVTQGRVLAPTRFGIFSAVLHHAFHDDDKNIITDGVFVRTRTGGRLFNLSRSLIKAKIQHILVRELLLVAVFVSHSETGLQSPIGRFFDACETFFL